MDYSVQDLIGMLNLGVILARGGDEVKLPKNAVIEIRVYLEQLKMMQEAIGS